ncbi:hypothetical protein ACFFLM_05035 [Deinococcus oregonensis]|uniref:Uncharacterized protein n=1 Tax=Deinococcus oregonensis TaxID=1805970 RepID=A0ABV6AWE8_9DEIO
MNVVKDLLASVLMLDLPQRLTLCSRWWWQGNLILADREQSSALTSQLSFERFLTIFQDVPAIEDVLSLWGTFSDPLFIF